MNIWRTLSPDEETTFRQWAKENYTPGAPANPLWHPVVREECERMNAEAGPTLTPYTIEVDKPIYKIPNVSNPGTFDLQVIRLNQEGADRQFRTTHTARIVRTSATRPKWHARTEEPRYRDEIDIHTGTLEECRQATTDYFHCIADPRNILQEGDQS